jgi:beta-galactosidase
MNYYKVDEKVLINKPIQPNFWRAPTDNDFGNRMDQRQGIWRNAGKNIKLQKFDVQHSNKSVVRIFATYEIPDARSTLKINYEVIGNGEVVIEMEMKPGVEGLPDLPRFGMQVELVRELNQLQYYGRGPHENYCDRFTSAFVDVYKSTVAKQYFPYIRPQENGYKTDVRWLIVESVQWEGLLFKSDPMFSFSALHYSTDDLDQLTRENYRHTTDLKRRQAVFVNIDFKQMGVGGDNSWGARPHKQYTLPAKDYKFSFSIRPYFKGDDPFKMWQEEY